MASGFQGFAVRGFGFGVVEVSWFGISRFLVRDFEVRVSGFRKFGVCGFGFWVSRFRVGGFEVSGLWVWVSVRISGFGFRGSGFRGGGFHGSGFQVSGFGSRFSG